MVSGLELAGVRWLEAVLVVVGIAGTLDARAAMGTSWRIGVDADERATLVTDGPLALVRKPIFSAMIPTGLGLGLLAPNPVALIGFALSDPRA